MSSPPERRRPRRLADTGGFTLIEALVAFVVLATILSVLFRGVVQMRAAAGVFDDRTHRDLVAQTVLAEVLAIRTLPNGRRSGVKDGRHWTLVAKQIDLRKQMPPPAAPDQAPQDGKDASNWVPQRLVLDVEAEGRPIEVETIRLVKAR